MAESARSIAKQMAFLIEQYNKVHGLEETAATEPHLVADWAVERRMWVKPPPTPQETLRKLLSRYLRAEHTRDPQGREVREYHAVLFEVPTADGIKRRSRWYRRTTAPPQHMLASLQLRRRAALSDVHQLSLDFDSYNDNNVLGAKLPPMDFNFNTDLEELKQSTSYPDGPPDDGTDDDGETI